MDNIEYEAKTGKKYKISIEKAPDVGQDRHDLFFRVRTEDKVFCYTLGVSDTIVAEAPIDIFEDLFGEKFGGKWAEEEIRRATLKKAQELLDQGREEDFQLCLTTYGWIEPPKGPQESCLSS